PPERPHDIARPRPVAFGDALRAPGEHDPFWREAANEFGVDVEGVNLAVDVRLAQAARNQLRILRAEIDDQDLRMRGCRHVAACVPIDEAGLRRPRRVRAIRPDSWGLPSRSARRARATR